MRVTIDHREEPTTFGRRDFYLDCTVEFSETERAVLRNRQLDRHFIIVDSDIPFASGISFFGYGAMGLRILSRAAAISTFIAALLVMVRVIHDNWFLVFLIVSVGAFAYRKWGEYRFGKSIQERQITLGQLAQNGKFTVYAQDAFNARRTESAIIGQLTDLKNRMVEVQPALARSQVYAK